MDDLTTAPAPGAMPVSARDILGPLGPWVMRGALIFLGIAVLIGGIGYGITDEAGHVGSGFMPFAAGLVMLLAGLWEAFASWRTAQRAAAASTGTPTQPQEESAAEELDVFGRNERQRKLAVVKVFGILLGATVLAELIGLLLSMTVMVVVLLWWIERKPWWAALAGGLIAFLFGYLVFGVFLDVPLATGLLGLI